MPKWKQTPNPLVHFKLRSSGRLGKYVFLPHSIYFKYKFLLQETNVVPGPPVTEMMSWSSPDSQCPGAGTRSRPLCTRGAEMVSNLIGLTQ